MIDLVLIAAWLITGWVSSYIIWRCERRYGQRCPTPIGIIAIFMGGVIGVMMVFAAVPIVFERGPFEFGRSWWSTPICGDRED